MENDKQISEYEIKGLHCSGCLDDLLGDYDTAFEKANVKYDKDRNVLLIGKDANWNKLDKIASFEKIYFEKVKDIKPTDKHDHEHSHGHQHDISNQSVTKMWTVFGINVFFSIFEFIFGILINSSAILADAVHDLGDAVSIGIAALLEGVSKREPTNQFSFGYTRFSLLGSVITALVLIIGSVVTLFHSVPRLFDPQVINQDGMFWIAIIAIAANGLAAWLLRDGKSANESMLNLHLLEDVFGWLAVLVVSIVLQFTDWYILDPILSIGIAIYIFFQALPSLKKSVVVFLEGVPEGLDAEEIEQAILNVEGVQAISHFHLWSLDGQSHSMSLTVSVNISVVKNEEKLKRKIREVVFPQKITHVTIEIVKDNEQLLN